MDAMMAACAAQLQKAHEEIKAVLVALPPEALDWSPGAGMNTAAALATHVAGAERWLIGELAGREPAARNRDAEFLVAGRPAEELCGLLDATLAHSLAVLARVTGDDVAREFTHPRTGQIHTAGWAIVQAVGHAGTHLGHLEMTRQLWDGRR